MFLTLFLHLEVEENTNNKIERYKYELAKKLNNPEKDSNSFVQDESIIA